MTESESVALPLGDGPMLSQQMVLYIGCVTVSTTFLIFLYFFAGAQMTRKIAVPAYQPLHMWFHPPTQDLPFRWYAQ